MNTISKLGYKLVHAPMKHKILLGVGYMALVAIGLAVRIYVVGGG